MMSASDVVDVLGLSLLGIVPDDENIVIATNKGEPLVDTDTAAGEAYMNICRRICGKDVPIPDFSHKENKVIRFMSKLFGRRKKPAFRRVIMFFNVLKKSSWKHLR